MKGEQMTEKWQPRYIVRKADGVGGPPIPDDEPYLVIRAQDILAVRMLRIYVDMYTLLDGYSDEVADELGEHLDVLAKWALTHETKVADR